MSLARCITLVLSLAVACGLASAPRAAAQLERGTRERALAAFDSYDLDGVATLDAIRLLSPTTPDGEAMVGATRLAHARAATDLWLISWLDPERADLDADLAEALGVPSFALVSTLRGELEGVGGGEPGEEARQVEEAIALREAIESGQPVSLAGTKGLRRDALLVHLVGTAIEDGDDAELEAWYDDPCDDPRACHAPWSEWARSSRVIVAALVDAADALARLDEAWWAGDPFARAARPALADDARRLELHVHGPAPVVPFAMPISTAPDDEGRAAHVDLLVLVGEDRVRIVRVASFGIRDGRLEELDLPDYAAPRASEVVVPSEGDDPEALAGLVDRLRAARIEPGAVVAVGVDDEVAPSRLQRVLASMAQAQRAPSVVVRRASDGSLRAAPIQVIDADAVGAPGDVVVDAVGGEWREGLVGAAPGRRVVVRAGEASRARSLVDAAFQAARDGDLVALVGQ